MSRLDSLRGKIPRRPSPPDNASGQGRRRTKRQADPAVAAAGRALSDAREVFGDVPRDADADHLHAVALRPGADALVEVVREGVALLEEVGGKPRRPRGDAHGPFTRAVLASKPLAYWRLNEWGGPTATDAVGRLSALRRAARARRHGPCHAR